MKVKKAVRTKIIISMLLVTGLLSRYDFRPPSKWKSFLETFQVSSGVFNSRLSCIDREVQQDYRKIERRLGIESYYDPDYIADLKSEVESDAEKLKLDRGF
jgi:hypothetical protein